MRWIKRFPVFFSPKKPLYRHLPLVYRLLRDTPSAWSCSRLQDRITTTHPACGGTAQSVYMNDLLRQLLDSETSVYWGFKLDHPCTERALTKFEKQSNIIKCYMYFKFCLLKKQLCFLGCASACWLSHHTQTNSLYSINKSLHLTGSVVALK